MGNNNGRKISQAERRRKTARLVQAIIALLLVLGMIIAVIVTSFGN